VKRSVNGGRRAEAGAGCRVKGESRFDLKREGKRGEKPSLRLSLLIPSEMRKLLQGADFANTILFPSIRQIKLEKKVKGKAL